MKGKICVMAALVLACAMGLLMLTACDDPASDLNNGQCGTHCPYTRCNGVCTRSSCHSGDHQCGTCDSTWEAGACCSIQP